MNPNPDSTSTLFYVRVFGYRVMFSNPNSVFYVVCAVGDHDVCCFVFGE